MIRTTGALLNYVVYISKEAFRFDKKTLSEILVRSREWNAEHGISGILLYHSGNIMQVLEGSEEEVQAIFKAIETDKRHKEVTKIADNFIEKRNFKDWSMAFRTASPEFFHEVSGYTQLNGNLLPEERTANHSILFLLKTFLALNPSVDDSNFGKL